MMAKIEWYEEILALEPGSKVFFPFAKRLETEGLRDKAIAVLRQGLTQHPEYLEARVFLSHLLGETGATLEAAAEAAVVVEKLTGYPTFWDAASLARAGMPGDSALLLALLAESLRSPKLTVGDFLRRSLRVPAPEPVCPDDSFILDLPDLPEPSDPSDAPATSEEASELTADAPETEGMPDFQPALELADTSELVEPEASETVEISELADMPESDAAAGGMGASEIPRAAESFEPEQAVQSEAEIHPDVILHEEAAEAVAFMPEQSAALPEPALSAALPDSKDDAPAPEDADFEEDTYVDDAAPQAATAEGTPKDIFAEDAGEGAPVGTVPAEDVAEAVGGDSVEAVVVELAAADEEEIAAPDNTEEPLEALVAQLAGETPEDFAEDTPADTSADTVAERSDEALEAPNTLDELVAEPLPLVDETPAPERQEVADAAEQADATNELDIADAVEAADPEETPELTEFADESTAEPVGKGAEASIETPAEAFAEESAERLSETASETASDSASDSTSDELTEEIINEPTEETAEETAEEVAEEVVEDVAEDGAEDTTEESADEDAPVRTRSMAEVLAEQGDLDGALAIYDELLEKAPESEHENLHARMESLKKLKASEKPVPEKSASAKADRAADRNGLRSMLENLAGRLEKRARR